MQMVKRNKRWRAAMAMAMLAVILAWTSGCAAGGSVSLSALVTAEGKGASPEAKPSTGGQLSGQTEGHMGGQADGHGEGQTEGQTAVYVPGKETPDFDTAEAGKDSENASEPSATSRPGGGSTQTGQHGEERPGAQHGSGQGQAGTAKPGTAGESGNGDGAAGNSDADGHAGAKGETNVDGGTGANGETNVDGDADGDATGGGKGEGPAKEPKRVALTFDDGPDLRYTTAILDILKEEGVKATFFVVGTQVDKYPEVVQRMVEEGHAVGNHSYRHKDLSKLSASQILAEIRKTDKALEEALGTTPLLFRAPYGAVSDTLKKTLAKHDRRLVGWTVDTRDWSGTSIADMREMIRNEALPDGIILMHSFGSKHIANTVEMLSDVIRDLRELDFSFVTADEIPE